MTTYPELTDIRDAAIRLHLDGSQFLAYLPIEVLAAAYNGTGPELPTQPYKPSTYECVIAPLSPV